jgi:hypothetical protein
MSTAFTVGRVDAGVALLLTNEQQLIEYPSALLPRGICAGSIVNISTERDRAAEEQVLEEFYRLQEEILREFSRPPEAPTARVRRATQTSLVVEWTELRLHAADLRKVTVLRDGEPAKNFVWVGERALRLHGLKVDTECTLQLQFHTSAGVVASNVLAARTQTLADITGVYAVFDGFDDNDAAHIKELRDLKELLRKTRSARRRRTSSSASANRRAARRLSSSRRTGARARRTPAT